MAFMKHVGKHGDRKVCILFRQVPGEDHMCLCIYPEVLPAHWQDSIQRALESEVAQQSEELADALHRSFLPDGRPVLETLHQERMIKKLRTSDVIVTPTNDAKIRLDELNKMLNEMKQGEAAIKKMAENDASRGMVAPEVKRKAEAEYKAGQAAKADAAYVAPPALKAGQDGALSDRDIAANMLAQAKAMEVNARSMIAEAARMKKDAERMDPTVTARATATAPATESVGLAIPNANFVYSEPSSANSANTSGLQSALAPMSSIRLYLPFFSGRKPAIGGRWIFPTVLTVKSEPTIIAPVFPALQKASTCFSFKSLNPTPMLELGF